MISWFSTPVDITAGELFLLLLALALTNVVNALIIYRYLKSHGGKINAKRR